MENPIQLIVGLGNPGPEYRATRHNAGVWCLQMLCDQWSLQLNPEKKFQGEFAVLRAAGTHRPHPLYLLFPTTMMNLSGNAVRAVLQFYKLQPMQMLVLHDEIDLPVGVTRLKKGGGHAGHNGLRDIIQACQSADFYRLRIGVGHPGEQRLVHDYVLHAPPTSEREAIMASLATALPVIPQLLQGNVETAMQQLHTLTRPTTPPTEI